MADFTPDVTPPTASRRTVVRTAAWSVPVLVGVTGAPIVSASTYVMSLSNANLEQIKNGLHVHVGLTNANINAVTVATVIVTLTDTTTNVTTSHTIQLTMQPWGQYAGAYVEFPNLVVGHVYSGTIHATAPGFVTINSPTNPPTLVVSSWS